MKPPEVRNIDEAWELTKCIRSVIGENKMWSSFYVTDMWRVCINDAALVKFNKLVADDWEHVWSGDQCQQIMAKWVEVRLSR